MKEQVVGRIVTLHYDTDDDSLRVTIQIENKKYQKKLLRDLHLSGHIRFEGNNLIYQDNSNEESD